MVTRDENNVLEVIEMWLDQEVGNEALSRQLGVDSPWVEKFEKVVRRYQLQLAATSASPVRMVPLAVTDDVEEGDEILVFADRIKISGLFTDSERLERRDQEGVVSFGVNGQASTVSWKRPLVRRFPKQWGPLDDSQVRLLYVGDPEGLLDFDVALLESDEPEREFFQRIADLLESAAAFIGLAPGAGTAASAALGLGAAIAKLIKAKIDDDAEMRFLGTLGGEDLLLKYGEYQLQRHAFSGISPEITIKLRIEKFEKELLPEKATILLDGIDFQTRGSDSIGNLQLEDRVVSDITITQTAVGDGTTSEGTPRANTLQIDRPFFGENRATWLNTLGINDKLLYDGPWGINLALTINMSGIPADINNEEWMAVIAQTGGLIESLVPESEQAAVRRGFTIAETVRSTVIKYLPATRFAASLSTLLFVGDSIEGLQSLEDNDDWQQVSVSLDLGDYGVAVFRLKVQLQS